MPGLRPTKVDGNEAGLSVSWSDGHQSVYSGRYLRGSCRCAECVDEWSSARKVGPESVPEGVYTVSGEVVGQYAVKFVWSDGHSTGIYSYDYLRSLCQCNECQAEHAGHNH